MDVNNENFEECFSTVSNAINEASFIAFDTEFTGLDDGNHITGLDTPEKRYFKLLKPAKEYLVVQFGLSIFKKIPGRSKFEVKSYNFAIFPRHSKFSKDVSLRVQGPSLEFITYQGLDFDEVINKGIPYLSIETKARIHSEIILKHSKEIEDLNSGDAEPSLESLVVPPWKKNFIDKQIRIVEDAMSEVTNEMLILEPCDIFSKDLLLDQFKLRFPERLVVGVDSSGGHDSVVIMVKVINDLDDKRNFIVKKHADELDELKRVLGFTRIIKLLHESNKLLVGHNMLLDVMHTISQFWSDLPSDYISFKRLVNKIFPSILDTKHMASMEPFNSITNNRNLKELYDDLKMNKKIASFVIEIPKEYPDYMTQTNFHNAAYDAFITGVCFLLMKSYLGATQKNVSIEEKVSLYRNKLYLMRIVDVPYMNLDGDDLPLTTRDHIFHIQFFKNKKMTDLKDLFAPFGDVDIKFIDENSAFVCMLEREKSVIANRKLSSPKDGWYKLQPLSEWHASRNEGSNPTHGNVVYRDGQVKRKYSDDNDESSFGFEVTQENFEDVILTVAEAINESSFLSICTQSLGFDEQIHMKEFDTPNLRYQNLVQPVKEHIVVEFGLCAFKKITGQKKYEAKPFNFSVYARSSKLAPDVFFSSENSKLQFDASKGLRVCKIVEEGVSYLSIANERSLCDKLLMRHPTKHDSNNHNNSPSTVVPMSKQEFVDRQIKTVEVFMSSHLKESIMLEPCNSFTRKLLYEQLNFRFPDQLFIETIAEDNNSCPLVKVTFVENIEHRKELEMKKQDKKLEDLHKALGFTRIIKMLHESNKLLVGHNMLLDVMHTISQFWSELPHDYKSFKSLCSEIFPRVLDTRHMASTEPFKGLIKNKDLENLHRELKTLNKSPNIDIEIPGDFPSGSSLNSAHRAYKTGICYLLMNSLLGTLQKKVSVDDKSSIYENKLHLLNIEDVPFINLRGNDLPLERDHIYHVQFRRNKNQTPVKNILSSQGSFKMLDDTSAVVRIYDNDKLATIKKSLSTMKNGGCKLQPLKDWSLSTDLEARCTSVLRESPPNLKRKHDDDNRTISKKIPVKRKLRNSSDNSKINEGTTDPLKLFHFEAKKAEGVQKPPLFDVPDEWD